MAGFLIVVGLSAFDYTCSRWLNQPHDVESAGSPLTLYGSLQLVHCGHFLCGQVHRNRRWWLL